jgi:hypothetical protein
MAVHAITRHVTAVFVQRSLQAAARAEQLDDKDDTLEMAHPDEERDEFMAELARAMKILEAAPDGPVMWAPEDAMLANVQAFLDARAYASGLPEDHAPDVEEVTYDDDDWLGWAGSFFQWWRKLRPQPFREPDAPSFTAIPNQTSIAMFGDWGSGRYGAPVIARTVAAWNTPLSAVIHLGDTYYAGTPDELLRNVLAVWPRRSGTLSFLMNGNHERYGGDIGYYQAMEQLNQRFSYFALANDYFLMVGLDSAYADCDLAGKQVTWLEALRARLPGRKLILLSHHQPYSAFEGGAGAMVQKLKPLLDARGVAAWFWGHEHRCVLYDAHPAWSVLGRCIGHGGYPYFLVEPGAADWQRLSGLNNSLWYRFPAVKGNPAGRILADPNPYVSSPNHAYGAHGFVIVGFDGPRCIETYLRPNGEKVQEQVLPV